MTALRLLRRRARAHAGLLLLVLLQIALTTAAVVAATGYVAVAVRAGLGDTLAAAPDAALRVQTGLSSDPAAQADAATTVLDEHLADLPVDARRWLATAATAATRGPADGDPLPAEVALWADPTLPDAADLTAGAWPTAPDQAAIHAGTAALLDRAVGDTLTVAGDGEATVPLTVTGTWLPTDALAPRWAGDPLATDGSADDGATAGTGQLDSANAAIVMDLLAELVHTKGVAAVVTTHDPLMVQRADRVLDLHSGRLR